MITKHFELSKLNLSTFSIYLFYGKNQGIQDETIEKYFTKDFNGQVNKYEENEFINGSEFIISEMLNGSLFENQKILIISRVSDKIIKYIEEILEKKLSEIKIILKTGILEKRSKLRGFFEKNKSLVTVPFYEDQDRNLTAIVFDFINKNKIKISRESVNLLVDRAGGDRKNLNIELDKILNYSFSNKTIEYETVKILSNLSENFTVGELVDSYLSRNVKNISKILNENNYSNEDFILILRTILIKSKRLLNVLEMLEIDKNIDKIIASIKPPIFWKEKDLVKTQAKLWNINDLKGKIYEINEIEALIKNNSKNSLNIISNFVISL